MADINASCVFNELPLWHQEILSRLLDASFIGKRELATQILASRFKIIDANQSLEILATDSIRAPVIKTIPVEASAMDDNGLQIQVLLFTRHGLPYMLEVLRVDGGEISRLPPSDSFSVTVLGT